MTAARRISLPLLIDLLSITGNQVAEFWQKVGLGALGEAVSWAGPGPAPAWLYAARDFSEYCTRHQQICEAIGRAGLVSPDYLRPVLDTFMRALPHTLRHVTAAKGTALQMTVTGPGGGEWACIRGPDCRRLQRQPHPRPAARSNSTPTTA